MNTAWTQIEHERRVRGLTIGKLCRAAKIAERSYYDHRACGSLTPRLAKRLSGVLQIEIRQAWTVEADTA